VVEWEGHRFTQDGYLVDTTAWSPELAVKIAVGLNVELTDAHWAVLQWARDDYTSVGKSPNVRRIAVGSGLGTASIYQLFPGKPGIHVAMVAGIPKPAGCV